MMAATSESTRGMISVTALVLLISIGSLVPKATVQPDKYSKWRLSTNT
jgi:hypothetical protein